MERPLTLVLILAVLSGALTFLGTLLSAPAQINRGRFANDVRQAVQAGDWATVTELSRKAVRADPRFQEALLFLGLAEDRIGSARRASHTWSRLERVTRENIERGNGSAVQQHFLGWALSGQGKDEGARAAWRELAATMDDSVDRYNRVCFLALAGRTEEALAEWERYVSSRRGNGMLGWARVDPDLEGIRSDPRFEGAISIQASPGRQRSERPSAF